jgi:hypothetical protein
MHGRDQKHGQRCREHLLHTGYLQRGYSSLIGIASENHGNCNTAGEEDSKVSFELRRSFHNSWLWPEFLTCCLSQRRIHPPGVGCAWPYPSTYDDFSDELWFSLASVLKLL